MYFSTKWLQYFPFLSGVCILLTELCFAGDKVNIGGMFVDGEDDVLNNAFQYAIKSNDVTRFVPIIQSLPLRESFKAVKQVCRTVETGVVAIFGPTNYELSGHINSLCSALEIPHIETRLGTVAENSFPFSVNMHPDYVSLSQIYVDIINYFNWGDIFVIYGDQNELLHLQEVLTVPVSSETRMVIRQASKENMRDVLKEGFRQNYHHFIADLSLEDTHYLLKAALQLGMINYEYHYILTNLDIDCLDLEDFKYNFVNLTSFRLVDYDKAHTKHILSDIESYERQHRVKIFNTTGILKTETALMIDAVSVLSYALQDLNRSAPFKAANLSCDQERTWNHGSSLYNCLNLVEYKNEPGRDSGGGSIIVEDENHIGLTGKIHLENGRRTKFKLNIMQLTQNGLIKVGDWKPEVGINFTLPVEYGVGSARFGNKTLIVSTTLEPPYIMLKKPPDDQPPHTGNDRYEGFCIDMLKGIAKIVGFTYEIRLVADANYGVELPNGSWNGLIGELREGKADLAVASLTISYGREQVIDFTAPFMHLGISILFKVPKREKPGLWSFLNPFAREIWLYLFASYVTVGVSLFLLARFSPYEWYRPHQCGEDEPDKENDLTLANCFWFAIGTLTQQGSDIDPKALATRIVGGTWFFFTLILISSYTANLAAFLTVEKSVSPIENVEDLAKQTNIKYGSLGSGSTMTFFKDSKIETYKTMWKEMNKHKEQVFAKSTKEGIQKVKQGNYAFLMESTMLDYTIQRDCDLMQVGGLLDSKDYGIGTPIGSVYKDSISMAILKMQEDGKIQQLYNRWWRNSGTCTKDSNKGGKKGTPLGRDNIGGIFIVLLSGLAIAVIVAFMEFTWSAKKRSNLDRQSLCQEMGDELRFAMQCHGSSQRTALRRDCSGCNSTDDLEMVGGEVLENPTNGMMESTFIPHSHSHRH
ncbi:unnamed protein product [Owenia fusiformis]|uniref:Uncharacterized protein n=1 Tax=Owenia fusiformis TaxID=6347 RepID=A0A8J1XJU2_OWEFU|nr:unnamed protein product [Owenia fusiformis]